RLGEEEDPAEPVRRLGGVQDQALDRLSDRPAIDRGARIAGSVDLDRMPADLGQPLEEIDEALEEGLELRLLAAEGRGRGVADEIARRTVESVDLASDLREDLQPGIPGGEPAREDLDRARDAREPVLDAVRERHRHLADDGHGARGRELLLEPAL